MKWPWVSRARFEDVELEREIFRGQWMSERANADESAADYRALSADLAKALASNTRLLSANEALKARLAKFSGDKPRGAHGRFLPSKGNGVGAVG